MNSNAARELQEADRLGRRAERLANWSLGLMLAPLAIALIVFVALFVLFLIII